MNERQRDLFLWLWSERRKPGQGAIALRGAVIGALGGLLFTLLMLGSIDAAGGAYTGLAAVLSLLERGGLMLVLAVAAFAGIGFMLANRVFAAQERMYQSMLSAGARVPDHKPKMQPGDRGPAVAVGLAVAVIAGFILYLFVTLG